MPTTTVWYRLVTGENVLPGTSLSLEVEKNVAELVVKVKEQNAAILQHAAPAQFIVWRCKDRSIVLNGENLGDHVRGIFSNGEAEKLDGRDTFADLAVSATETLLVQVPAVRIPELETGKRRLEAEDAVSKRQRFSEAQEHDVAAARMALPPSSAAAMPAFRHEQDKRPVLNGRPHDKFGLPVGLFHPVFNSFYTAMRNQECLCAGAATYSSVRALFTAFANIYDTEAQRITAIDKHLVPLLGDAFVNVEVQGIRSDGVIIESCGPSTAYLLIREVKNEIGTGSADPYNQGSLTYRRYWAEAPRVIRDRCHCPSFILAIAGPWLCVLGGVYLQKAVVQPLTDYVWLGGDNFNDERLLFASRLFTALRSAISSLRSYYRALQPSLLNPIPQDLTSEFPFITQYGSKKFTYLLRLAPEYPNKLSYKATLEHERRMVVVKFVSTYHAQAHRILAEHKLAPVLHYASTEDTEASMYGGRYMIVMDFIDGKPAVGSLPKHQFKRIEQAIQLLHSQDLVFGDLRSPNILVTDKNAMIIDFDWCGKAGEACYPANMNTAEELGWPEGVGPDSIMMKEHDLFMLEKLRSHSI